MAVGVPRWQLAVDSNWGVPRGKKASTPGDQKWPGGDREQLGCGMAAVTDWCEMGSWGMPRGATWCHGARRRAPSGIKSGPVASGSSWAVGWLSLRIGARWAAGGAVGCATWCHAMPRGDATGNLGWEILTNLEIPRGICHSPWQLLLHRYGCARCISEELLLWAREGRRLNAGPPACNAPGHF